jgi:hypothetical protein
MGCRLLQHGVAKRSLAVMPAGLVQALGPVLEQIAAITLKTKHYDRQIQLLGQTESPEPVSGSLAFVRSEFRNKKIEGKVTCTFKSPMPDVEFE